MNCEQANQIDLVEYLSALGFSPAKISDENYWYQSPLRQETTPSFKVNRTKNVWYDHGIGKGGTLVDLVMILMGCDIAKALEKILTFRPHNFNPHLPALPDPGIEIISTNSPITDINLKRYLNQRNISRDVANEFCKQVLYKNADKKFVAIGFKNNSGGYELRSERFKGSSSPKYVTYLDNGRDNISVFEGFFDFLTYASMHPNNQVKNSNILVLNSLSFFTRSLLLMEKHQKIHLYLDNDKAGKQCVEQAMKRSNKVSDESHLYKGYKDLNEWSIGFGKSQRKDQSYGLRR